MNFVYAYPRPSVTVDATIFRKVKSGIEILLIQRGREPFKGGWALPGGFLDMEETLEEAIHRELEEETGLKGIELKQLHAFSSLHRDPRGRTISVVFIGILQNNQQAVAGDDASAVNWFHLNNLPYLAFDHSEVIKLAVDHLRQPTPDLHSNL